MQMQRVLITSVLPRPHHGKHSSLGKVVVVGSWEHFAALQPCSTQRTLDGAFWSAKGMLGVEAVELESLPDFPDFASQP